jgi:hypothetical protein
MYELQWWQWLRKFTKRHALYNDDAPRRSHRAKETKGFPFGQEDDDKENGMRVEFLSDAARASEPTGSLWAIEDDGRNAHELRLGAMVAPEDAILFKLLVEDSFVRECIAHEEYVLFGVLILTNST